MFSTQVHLDALPSATMEIFTIHLQEEQILKVVELIVYDHNYFSDMYLSKWDPNTKSWSRPSNLLGKINTEFHDGNLSLLPIILYLSTEIFTTSQEAVTSTNPLTVETVIGVLLNPYYIEIKPLAIK